jgi:hypothetical protein
MENYVPIQKIEYIIDNNIFIIEPIEFYYCERPVIFYKFIHEKTGENPEKLEAILPLYMSDGQTNKLRSNLLLPFLCIESGDITDTCPHDLYITNPGQVYKLTPCNDANTILMHNNIIDNIKKVIPNYETTTEFKKLNDEDKKGSDLFSVLPRMNSFIFLLLNIINPKIKYYIDNKREEPNLKKAYENHIHYGKLLEDKKKKDEEELIAARKADAEREEQLYQKLKRREEKINTDTSTKKDEDTVLGIERVKFPKASMSVIPESSLSTKTKPAIVGIGPSVSAVTRETSVVPMGTSGLGVPLERSGTSVVPMGTSGLGVPAITREISVVPMRTSGLGVPAITRGTSVVPMGTSGLGVPAITREISVVPMGTSGLGVPAITRGTSVVPMGTSGLGVPAITRETSVVPMGTSGLGVPLERSGTSVVPMGTSGLGVPLERSGTSVVPMGTSGLGVPLERSGTSVVPMRTSGLGVPAITRETSVVPMGTSGLGVPAITRGTSVVPVSVQERYPPQTMLSIFKPITIDNIGVSTYFNYIDIRDFIHYILFLQTNDELSSGSYLGIDLYLIELVNLFVKLYNDTIRDDKIKITIINKKYSDFIKINKNELNKKIQICVNKNINTQYLENYKIFTNISTNFSKLYLLNDNLLSSYIRPNPSCNFLEYSFETFNLSCDTDIKIFFEKLTSIFTYKHTFIDRFTKNLYNPLYNKKWEIDRNILDDIIYKILIKVLNFIDKKINEYNIKNEFIFIEKNKDIFKDIMKKFIVFCDNFFLKTDIINLLDKETVNGTVTYIVNDKVKDRFTELCKKYSSYIYGLLKLLNEKIIERKEILKTYTGVSSVVENEKTKQKYLKYKQKYINLKYNIVKKL